MTENSPAGLVMLGAEVTVTVTREEHHQAALARYPVAPGAQRQVAVELTWCTITSGKYRGQPAIEVRLDGARVGELTYLMSQRYAAFLTQVTSHGARPGCQAVIQRGARGLEVVLRLPRPTEATMPIPPVPRHALPTPPPAPATPRRRAWIVAAAVVGGLIIIGAVANAGNDNSPPAANRVSDASTTTTKPTTTTTPPPATTTEPTTTTTTTTIIAPPPPPPPNPPAPAPATPKTTTTKRATPPPPPATQPQSGCDPNYTGCVPIASDVDCAGGTGNGPAYVQGPIRVIGRDIYDLDRDHDGIACE